MEKNGLKALGLLSGGLDSHIAVKFMLKLGYDVVALNYLSPFCNCTKKSDGCKSAAHMIAKECGIEIKTLFMGDEYIEMLRAPRYGYGKGMNPCIDCRILMFKHAKNVMEEIGARFIFTGEVLNQRPMSQMRDKLRKIEKESGLEGLIVRPLSAAILEPTVPEKEGWINREKMLAFSGRSRKPQIKIGREMGIKEGMLCSSGGCLLTDLNFAAKVKDLFEHTETTSVKDIRILRLGRHFRISDNCKVVVGRNEQENEKLSKIADEEDTVIQVKNFPGPCVILSGTTENGENETAARIAARYASAPPEAKVELEFMMAGSNQKETLTVRPLPDEEIEPMRI